MDVFRPAEDAAALRRGLGSILAVVVEDRPRASAAVGVALPAGADLIGPARGGLGLGGEAHAVATRRSWIEQG
jgi:hypothetical protein